MRALRRNVYSVRILNICNFFFCNEKELNINHFHANFTHRMAVAGKHKIIYKPANSPYSPGHAIKVNYCSEQCWLIVWLLAEGTMEGSQMECKISWIFPYFDFSPFHPPEKKPLLHYAIHPDNLTKLSLHRFTIHLVFRKLLGKSKVSIKRLFLLASGCTG